MLKLAENWQIDLEALIGKEILKSKKISSTFFKVELKIINRVLLFKGTSFYLFYQKEFAYEKNIHKMYINRKSVKMGKKEVLFEILNEQNSLTL